MLRQLRIQNFKLWKDTGNIRMAPITLFFGANSSGKSSIGQFMMMLKQTVESPDRKAVFYPGGKNSAVQLGSYQEMVFHRKLDNKISFEYQWDFQDALQIRDPIASHTYSGDILSFEAVVGIGDKQKYSLVVDHLKYQLMANGEQTLAVWLERKPGAKSEYKANAEQYTLVRKQMRAWSLRDTVRFYGFPDEVVAYYQNADFVQDLNLRHEKLFQSLFYLGPLRTKAERLYSWGGVNPESVGYAGENTIAAILAARNRKISLIKPKAKRASPAKRFEEIIALKLAEMGLIEEFKVNPISEQRQEYEVKVRTKGSRDWVDLPDVGFGISQVLPVLVQCFYAPAGSIILMEQPEIHLHPRAQSALADVMIDVINSRENGADRDIQLIIETHSEHFLRRLQRRIAEDVVPQEEVSAYFANIAKTPATLDPLQIDTFGSIQNWPENFFGDEMGDITEQAKAAMKKRMSQSGSESEVSE
jgi:predicted ATPase